jgi:hypothetical protein
LREVVVRRWGLMALLLIPMFVASATAGGIVKLALPVPEPELQPQPQRPVGEPDTPPTMGLDFFGGELDGRSSVEEAWPWPINPEGN